MLNKYKNKNKDLTEYIAYYVKKGTSKTGEDYTLFKVGCKKKQAEGKDKPDNEWYTVFCWGALPIKDKDKVVFKDIYSVDFEYSIVNGKPTYKRMIFADVEVIPTEQQEQMEMSEVFDETVPF